MNPMCVIAAASVPSSFTVMVPWCLNWERRGGYDGAMKCQRGCFCKRLGRGDLNCFQHGKKACLKNC